MATPSVRSQAASILTALQEHCLLVNVSFHRWTGQLVVRGANVSVGPVGPVAPPKIAPPRWQLVPPYLKKAIDRIESRTRRELDHRSVPFLLKGVHIVPVVLAGNLFDELVTLRAELHTTVSTLAVADYAKLVAAIRKRLGSAAFKLASPYIPAASTMLDRFGLEWWVFALAVHRSTRQEYKQVPFLGEAEEQFAQRVVDAAEELVQRLHGELATAADNLAGRVANDDPIKKGTLDQVRRAYAKLRAFGFLADDELLATIDRLDRRMGRLNPRGLKQQDEHWKRELVELLRATTAAARNEKAIRDVLTRLTGEPVTA